MKIADVAPAVHPSGLRAFARPMHGYQSVIRNIGATTETAGSERSRAHAGLRHHPIATTTGRSPGLMMPRADSTGEHAVRMKTSPGTNIAAAEALQTQAIFTRDQVAYLVAMAYDSGLAHGRSYDMAELLSTWAEKHQEMPTREDRIAAEIAAMEVQAKAIHRERGWPEDYQYRGGPVDWETGLPLGGVA